MPNLPLALCLAFSLSAFAQSAPAPPPEQIVEKSIAAAGGRQAREKSTSTYAKAVMEIAASGSKSVMEFWAKAPNMRLIVIELEGFGTVRTAYDGKAGWSQDPARGLRDLRGEELAQLQREAVFNPELKWREIYPKAETIGKQKIGDREAWAVRLTPAEGKPITRFYDAETFLLLGQESEQQTPRGTVKIRTTMSDYRDVGGVKAPFRVTQSMPGAEIVIRMSEIKNNIEIQDSLFAKPAK